MEFHSRTRQSPFPTKASSSGGPGSTGSGVVPPKSGNFGAPAPDDFNFDSWDTSSPAANQQQQQQFGTNPNYQSTQQGGWNQQPQGQQQPFGVRPPGGGYGGGMGNGGVTAPSNRGTNGGGGQLYGNQIGGQQPGYPQPAHSAFPQAPRASGTATSPFPQQQQQQHQHQQPGPGAGQAMFQQIGNEMMGAAGVNPAMVNAASMIGAQFINTEAAAQAKGMFAKYMPENLRGIKAYFRVTHLFVAKKFKFLCFPFRYIIPGTSGGGITDEQARPDLYVPLMAYITYIVLYGLNKGVHQRFQPHILSTTASFAAVLLILEVLAGSLGFFLVGTQNITMLDLVSYSGYKYVPLVIWLVLCLTGACDSYGYYVFFVYFSACAAISLYVVLNRIQPAKTGMAQDLGMRNNSMMHQNVIFILTGAQVGLFWLLTPPLSRLVDPNSFSAKDTGPLPSRNGI